MDTPTKTSSVKPAPIERVIGLTLLLLIVVMKVVAAYRYRFNTDETQHLHVVWGWAHGLVQYRDVFDNHPPLFHMLMAPVFRLFPETADIVVVMRLCMIPFYLAGLLAVYRICGVVTNWRLAMWATLAAAVMPGSFLPGIEFRPDDVYAAFWLWALAIGISGRVNVARGFFSGLLLGVCAGITMKTSLLMSSLGISIIVALGVGLRELTFRFAWHHLVKPVAAFCVGGLIVPLCLAVYFESQHALGQLYYCILRHNIVPHAERWNGSALHYYYFPVGIVFCVAAALWICRGRFRTATMMKRTLVVLLPTVYTLLLYSYWPDITEQDHLPMLPLAPVAVLCLIESRHANFIAFIFGRFRSAFFAVEEVERLVMWVFLVISVAVIWHLQFLQRGSAAKYEAPIAAVLKLTNPDEYVMDLKGDCVYRKRPIYFAIETFVKLRIKLGWIKNDIVERMIATDTMVCFHPPYPGADVMKFIDGNYLPLELFPNILVAGQRLAVGVDNSVHFRVSIPGDYVLIQKGEMARGVLDSESNSSSGTLKAGSHVFVPDVPGVGVTLFWARAWAEGYRPDTK